MRSFINDGMIVSLLSRANLTISVFKTYTKHLIELIIFVLKGIVPFVATLLKRRFFVFFTVAFLLFLALVGDSNPAGPTA